MRRGVSWIVLVVALVLSGLAAPTRAESSVAELVEMLDASDSATRVRALNELRNRKDPRSIGPLVDRIPTMGSSGQYYALLVLDQFEDRRVKGPLRSLLKVDAPYVRLCAAQILDARGTKGMARVIQDELSDPALPRVEWTRMMVRLRYGRLPQDDRLVGSLVEQLVVDGDADVIRETAYVLDDSKVTDATAAYEALLDDARPGVRAVSVAYLRARGQDRDDDLAATLRTGEIPLQELYFVTHLLTDVNAVSPAPIVVDALLESTAVLLESLRTNELRAVVQLLGKLGDRRALPRMRELTGHESATVAKAAADAVAELTGTKPTTGSTATSTDAADTAELTRMLTRRDREGLTAWLEDEEATRRLSAADALRRMDDHRGLRTVLEEVACKDVIHRRSAVKILGSFRVREGVEPLIEAMLDDDSTVRSYARSGLQTTLNTLFPHRRFASLIRGGADTEASRTADAEDLRSWWASARDDAW